MGESLWRGVCASYPNALTYRTESYTFDETRGYQLCHYDVVVAQLVATCFINWSIFMIITCYAHLISMARFSKNQ